MHTRLRQLLTEIRSLALLSCAACGCWGAPASLDLLSGTEGRWRGNDFTSSNGVLVIHANDPWLSLKHPASFVSGTVYRLVMEYEWTGPDARKQDDFYVCLYVPGKWQDARYNLIPDNSLRTQGTHHYETTFDPSEVPQPAWVRLVKKVPAEVRITAFRIEPLTASQVLLNELKSRLIEMVVPTVVVGWMVLQFIVLAVVLSRCYNAGEPPRAGAHAVRRASRVMCLVRGRPAVKVGVVLLAMLLVGLSTAAVLIIRGLNRALAQPVTHDLLAGEWFTADSAEGTSSFSMCFARAPEGLAGQYWLETTVEVTAHEPAARAAVTIDFYGEGFDPDAAQVVLSVTNAGTRVFRGRYPVSIANAPSNLAVRVFTWNNCGVELEELRLVERPSLWHILVRAGLDGKE